MSFAPVTVTLALVSGPDLPPGEHPDRRIEMTVVLDAAGRLDEAAWTPEQAIWPARRILPDAPPQKGDVRFDPALGWTLRFWPRDGDRADAPPVLLDPGSEPLRPGEYVSVTEPGDQQYGYRVVGVAARALPDSTARG
jgi:hypothetical protein